MRVVVVGASGNLGTALLARLAADGAHQVVGICRRVPAAEAPYDHATWRSVDISVPAAADRLTGIFAGADAVVNLAWGFQPTRDAGRLHRVGVDGLAAVVVAAAAAEVPHLVHMSSVGAYSPAEPGTRVDETWPTQGVPTSVYSVQKAAAERELDQLESGPTSMTVTRFRPGLVLQRAAGSALLRYGLPAYVPGMALRLLPILPVDRSLSIPLVHADDVADAVTTALARTAGGAFNLAAEPAIGRAELAAAFHARGAQLPAAALRVLVDLSWRAHLQRIDAGWIDLAFSVPLLDTSRAARLLGWTPKWGAVDALRDAVDGMKSAAGTGSPVLRRRSVRSELVDLLRMGPITTRSVS